MVCIYVYFIYKSIDLFLNSLNNEISYVGDDYEYPNECEILDFQLRDRK